jgi:hypothetical protein
VTAPNHALTGAVIGLTVHEPWLAAPLAFLSHYVCDAIPHYDPAVSDKDGRIFTKEFLWVQLIAGGILCFALVVLLALTRPQYWLLAACCAFLAASPDLFWLPRYVHAVRTRKDDLKWNWSLRFHAFIQWKTAPRYAWLEAAWFIVFGTFVASRL